MDLHRHDEYSSFDGFGKAADLANLAKNLGHTALGLSNHGNTNGLVQHYLGCKEAGIKPVMGVEGYFLPVYKEQHRGYHLCLFAKNHAGYHNLNAIQYEGEKQKYYNPIWTFDLLEKYHDGLICTSACVAGYLAQMLKDGKVKMAEKFVKKMISIFGDDFYIEIQPYKISEPGLQEQVNIDALELASELNVKCILTSDSHRGAKDDLDTYLKMHEIAGHDIGDIKSTYAERYMPTNAELGSRFVKMHRDHFGSREAEIIAGSMLCNLMEIEDKVENDIFSGLEQLLPKINKDSDKLIKKKIKEGLTAKGKWTHNHSTSGLDYISRIQEEYDVIKELGFQDYFLIVADYVNWAKEHGIVVGPGRGSGCNCLVAYALGITEVDSLLFGLDFRRFLRKDKKKMPDIDLDFEQSRRHEVIEYIINKYPGQTARIASYGLYKVDNLINDLAKVCGLPTNADTDDSVVRANKAEIAKIKTLINNYVSVDGTLDSSALEASRETQMYNRQYNNIIRHFLKMYKKVRYIGTHAAGVAITGGNIFDYTSLRIDKSGDIYANYDLADMDTLHVVKFDILGLITMDEIGELRETTGITVNYDDVVNNSEVIKAFGEGNTNGVFQFDKRTVRDMLVNIGCNCFNDVVAANAMNRPGPLKLHMPEMYASGKRDGGTNDHALFFKYTKESYGTVIYQEQVQQICVYVGGMSWTDADKVMKMDVDKANAAASKANKEKNELKEKFVSGAVKNGLSEDQAKEAFEAMMVYSFNKGHATGYSLISADEMFYKVFYPTEFWFCKIKYAPNVDMYDKLCSYAVKDGCVIFLPHVNYSSERMRLRKVEGEYCLQQGLSEINGVGQKAAEEIYMERKINGIFTSFDNFYDRCKSRVVNERVIRILKENGVAQFDKKIYIKKVTAYNSALLMRAGR